MATYAELFELRHNSELKNKVTVAVIVAAESIRSLDPPDTNVRLAWAKAAFENAGGEVGRMLMAILAANKSVPAEDIEGASDTAIQTQVDAAVDLFAGS